MLVLVCIIVYLFFLCFLFIFLRYLVISGFTVDVEFMTLVVVELLEILAPNGM